MPMNETVPCRHCGKGTMMLGTRECDGCHELRVRIDRDPHIAAVLLASTPGYEMVAMLRDQFAMHAPETPPSWFHHKAPFEVPPPMNYRDALLQIEGVDKLDLEVRNSIIKWSNDPCYDMDDPDLNRIGQAAFDLLEAHTKKRAAVIEANEAATWFAWRWHYATTMMRVRGEL